jgi:hypothetical protein
MAAFVSLIGRRIGLKVGAGQVVEEDVEPRTKQILPALPQMVE